MKTTWKFSGFSGEAPFNVKTSIKLNNFSGEVSGDPEDYSGFSGEAPFNVKTSQIINSPNYKTLLR